MRSGGTEILLPQGITRPDFVARPRPETETQSIIYYAGGSSKREALLKMLTGTHGKTLQLIDGGPENNALDPVQIAAGKIEHAMLLLNAGGETKTDSRTQTVFIAADVQAHSPTLKSDGVTISETRGKPEELFDVRQVFQEMISSVRATGDKRNYRYLLEAGSESRTMAGAQTTRIEANTNFFHIALEEQAVEFLATANGIRLYLDELNRFLRSPQYLSNGLRRSGSPIEICGGLDLAVLEKLGAIRKINQTQKGGINFDSELKAAFLAAYVGFDISVLQQVNSNAQTLINQWPWLKGILEYAQGKTSQPTFIM